MDRWQGKVAVVTGASSGIGAAIVVNLANAGMRVIGLARRIDRVEDLKAKVLKNTVGELHAHKCDVTSENDIKQAFQWIENKFNGIDVLINNAGVGSKCNIIDADNTDKLRAIIDTNLTAVALCTREGFQLMQKHNITGHIIIINSISGHYVPRIPGRSSLGIYPASKFGVTAMTEVLRQEFQLLKSKTKITSISPGIVETEIAGDENLAKMKALDFPFLASEDIAEAVRYVLSTPPHVQVHELMIKPVGEVF